MNRRSEAMQIATEVALFLVTVAAIVGMHRLFQDGSYRGPLIFQAVAAHLTMAALRRARFRLLPAALVTVAVGAVVIACTQYLSTTWIVIPSPETFSQITSDMDAAWSVFRQQRAPAPVEPGFVVATSVTVWVIAFVADWGAFRTGVSFEALLPPATLFLFASVLGAEGQRSASAAFFVATAMLFLLMHRTWRQEDSASWAALHEQRGRWSLVSTGTVLAAGAVIVGACVGPALPGANDEPIFPWRDIGDNQKQRVVLSPLVDIRGRLVEQSDLQVFRVETDEKQYWRLTALDDFDGTIWKSTYDTESADGELPRAVPDGVDTKMLEQRFTILALGQIWLPGAYAPRSVEVAEGGNVKYDEASGTLIVPRDRQTSDGLEYTVQSQIPTFGAALRNAPTAIPEGIMNRYTDLPRDFSTRVTELATQITAGHTTQFDKALALQDYLRENYDYSTDIQQGHGKNALERFLLDDDNGKKGYCEQFAAVFAAMARSVDIPARVAVGFTWGEKDPNTNLYVVRGRNAHAWPEVYFEGAGWVQFEPTPGRGPANAPWLGIPEAQESDQSTVPGDTETEEPTGPVTTLPPSGGGGPTRPEEIDGGGVRVNEPSADDDSGVRFEAPPLGDIVRPAGLALGAYLLLVPLAFVAQRALRRARAREPDQKVNLAWWEANESAASSGIVLAPSLTVAERAARLRLALPTVTPAIDLLAGSVERTTYAEMTPTVEEADDVTAASATISTAAHQRLNWWNRALAYLDARRLWPQREQARRTAHGVERSR